METGILLIDKPAGLSSAGVLNRVKHRLSLEKVGHAGTLDPMATGLLICLVGRATRLASFATGGRKRYSGVIRFGLVTDSDDITGAVLNESVLIPDPAQVLAFSRDFLGKIDQVPPRVSAIKISGERAYRRAWRDEDFTIAARSVEINSFDLSQITAQEYRFVVECGSGTYIRSLARDLGERLGCGGTLQELRREASAPFEVVNAKPADEVQVSDMLSWDVLMPQALRISASQNLIRDLCNGKEAALRNIVDSNSNKLSPECGQVVIMNNLTGVSAGLLSYEAGKWRLGLAAFKEG